MSKRILLIGDDTDDADIFSDAIRDLYADAVLNHFDNGNIALESLFDQSAPAQI